MVCLHLFYWLMRKTKCKDNQTNTLQLIVLKHKLDIQYNNILTSDNIEVKIIEIYASMKKGKGMAEDLSLEYCTHFASAKVETGEISAVIFLRNMNKLESQKKLFRNIRYGR